LFNKPIMKDGMQFHTILGIRFLAEDYTAAKCLLDDGALMVVPAAPALATIPRDPNYHSALVNSDFAILDSGFLVLLLRYTKRIRLKRLSGLKFLRLFLEEEALRNERCLFLVDPNEEEMILNHRLLCSQEIYIDYVDHYVAPRYPGGIVEDTHLLRLLERRKPRYILINLGGGTQEKLGSYIKKNLSYRPGIICTGAAIAFLTHKQASIRPIFDTLYMGWLVRCLYDPRRFVPRYIKGLALIPLILRGVKR
jgi:N-acetylglucosaminyldiphosphoundecaprenol N-acetyl-beta-D-mannosaminyltransferase